MIRPSTILLILLGASCVSNPVDRTFEEQTLKQAEREFVGGQFLAAAGHYEAYLADNPQLQDRDRAKVHLMAGRAYLGAGRLDQAIFSFDQALGESPAPDVRWDIVFRRGVAVLMKGDATRALEAFRSVASAPPGERGTWVTPDELHYETALALFHSGDWKGGQNELGLVSPMGPFGKQARMRLGLTSFAVQVGAYQDDARARAEADKIKGIVRPIPGDKPLYAVVYGSFPRYEDAQREADRLKRQFPDAYVIP